MTETASEKMVQKRESPLQKDGQIHVLVADDDEMLRDLVASLLEREGFLVSAASGGTEAVDIIANRGVDVGVIDVKMPDMDGIEVLKRAKEIDPQIEVVMITGYTDRELAVESLKNHAYAFMKKPFADIADIPATVRKAAEKRQLVRENARLSEKVSRQNRLLREKLTELRLMHELTARLSHTMDLEALSRHLLEGFLPTASVEACSFLLLESEPPILLVRSKRELGGKALADAREVAARDAKELGGRNLRSETIRIQYRGPRPESMTQRYEVVGRINGHRSVVVTVKGELVGTLSMFRVGEEGFRCTDARMLSVLATQASRMIEGARECQDHEDPKTPATVQTSSAKL